MEIKWGLEPGDGIFLAGNPLEIPPVEIVKQGTAAVRNYFKEIEEKTVLLLQCKLLLVGVGAVGKTSLMKKLLDNNYRVEVGKEDTTRGIDIVPWELPCAFPGGKTLPVKIHFWESGVELALGKKYALAASVPLKRKLSVAVWGDDKSELLAIARNHLDP